MSMLAGKKSCQNSASNEEESVAEPETRGIAGSTVDPLCNSAVFTNSIDESRPGPLHKGIRHTIFETSRLTIWTTFISRSGFKNCAADWRGTG